MSRKCRFALVALLCACAVGVLANGGPFVIKYPNGDPAAKGILARIDPNLRPAKESRLSVVKEELKVAFEQEPFRGPAGTPPVASVVAAYTIENPTDKDIEIDFGFPILRGIYMDPFSMAPKPEVNVTISDKPAELKIISNSAIYGIIRQRSREAIDAAVQKDQMLSKLVSDVRSAPDFHLEGPTAALTNYLTYKLRWNNRDAALMVAYANVALERPGPTPVPVQSPLEAPFVARSFRDDELSRLVHANLGPLSAIGEQKATQLFAQLASRFDRKAASTYEGIFTAWGGDVRERSVDLATGQVRPREVTVDPEKERDSPRNRMTWFDPTIYARVDYLDPHANINDREKAACKTILKNLPVVFTFAPMNLLYYRATFPAKSTQVVTVSYKQYPYLDTGGQESYQLAYVLHPASLWKSFGPIELEIAVPEGANIKASVPCESAGVEDRAPSGDLAHGGVRSDTEAKVACSIYKTTLRDKTGELFVALGAASWKAATLKPEAAPEPKPKPKQAQRQVPVEEGAKSGS